MPKDFVVGFCLSCRELGKNFPNNLFSFRSCSYLQFHVASLEVLWLDTEFQPQDGGFEPVCTGNDGLVLSYKPVVCRLAVDIPGQVNCGFRATGCAVNPHVVTNLVARLSACYVGVLVGKNYPDGKKM